MQTTPIATVIQTVRETEEVLQRLKFDRVADVAVETLRRKGTIWTDQPVVDGMQPQSQRLQEHNCS